MLAPQKLSSSDQLLAVPPLASQCGEARHAAAATSRPSVGTPDTETATSPTVVVPALRPMAPQTVATKHVDDDVSEAKTAPTSIHDARAVVLGVGVPAQPTVPGPDCAAQRVRPCPKNPITYNEPHCKRKATVERHNESRMFEPPVT